MKRKRNSELRENQEQMLHSVEVVHIEDGADPNVAAKKWEVNNPERAKKQSHLVLFTSYQIEMQFELDPWGVPVLSIIGCYDPLANEDYSQMAAYLHEFSEECRKKFEGLEVYASINVYPCARSNAAQLP